MMENNKRSSTEINGEKAKRFRIDKKHVQGFAVGIILCAIAFAGLYFGTDGNFFTGTVASLSTVTDSDFNDEVLNADRPVLVVFTTAWDTTAASKQNLSYAADFANEYGNYCKVVTMNVDNAINTATKYNINSSHLLVLFNGGSLISKKTVVNSEQNLFSWVTQNVIWEYHTPQQTNGDSTATLYNMFDSGSTYDRANYANIDVVGELRLFPFDAAGDSYLLCQGQTLTGDQYATLGLTFPVGVSNGTLTVTLADLTKSEPLQGVNYYVSSSGSYPQSATATPATEGDITFFGHECTTFDNFYLGEIKLISNLDESKYADDMIPCDGRELKISDYKALFSLLGTTYGGDGTTTFGIPDLSGQSPIDGGTYYIMLQGIYLY